MNERPQQVKRRTGLWILLVLIVTVSAFWFATRWVTQTLLGTTPSLADETVLHLPLSGTLGERPPSRWVGTTLGPLTVREIDLGLRRAAKDDRIKALMLDIGPLATGFAKAQEVRAAISAFRASGKPVIAILEIGTLLDLYMATTADTIFQIPTGQLLVGLVSRHSYYRELLDTLGIEFQVLHTGPYKSAMNSYTELSITPGEAEVANSLLDSIWGQILADIAQDRSLSITEVETALDQGLLTATTARDVGLIDRVGFTNDVDEELEELGAVGPTMGLRDYLEASQAFGSGLPLLSFESQAVALVHISGMLLPGESVDDLFGLTGTAGGDTVARHIRSAREDTRVGSIVLRIDSPGGAVTTSDIIWREAKLASEQKPLIISMSDVAASGGYWIATASQDILADEATYTGSIGVVMSRINLERSYKKVGIHNDLITRGANADLFSDVKPLNDGQMDLLSQSVGDTYRAFIDRVAEARGMTIVEVEALAAGRVWTGSQAVENGLIDQIGGLHAAIRLAKERMGAHADTDLPVHVYPRARSFVDQLLGLLTLARTSTRIADLRHDFPIPHGVLDTLTFVRILRRAGPAWALALPPVPLAIR